MATAALVVNSAVAWAGVDCTVVIMKFLKVLGLTALAIPVWSQGQANTQSAAEPLSPAPTPARLNSYAVERPAMVVMSNRPVLYYPKALRDAGIKGEVVVEVTVDRRNNISRPRIIRSDRVELEPLAIEAVLGWEYEAAIAQGQMVKSRLQVTVRFDPAVRAPRPPDLEKSNHQPDKKLPPEYQYDEPPVAVRSLKPVYPYHLLLKGRTGRAAVIFVVDPSGHVHDARVKSASEPEFGAALAAMADAMEFEPATKDGKPCWALLSIETVFNRIRPESSVDAATKDLLNELEQSSPKIYAEGELDAKLSPVYRIGPIITDAHAQSGEAASAVIEVVVDHNGRARLPRIVSATREDFGWAAATAASRWVFDPALKGGEPVYVRVKIPFKYTPPQK